VRTETTDGVDRAAISAGVRIDAGPGEESFGDVSGLGAAADFGRQESRPKRQMPTSAPRRGLRSVV